MRRVVHGLSLLIEETQSVNVWPLRAWPQRLRREISLLVADDDDSCRSSLVDCFDQPGFRVVSAEDGKQAIEILKAKPTDFVVMDIHMPGLTGIEVLRHLRTQGVSLPCILVSAASSTEVRDQAFSVGAFSLVEKPVRLELLRLSVHELLMRYFFPSQPSSDGGASNLAGPFSGPFAGPFAGPITGPITGPMTGPVRPPQSGDPGSCGKTPWPPLPGMLPKDPDPGQRDGCGPLP